MAANLVPRALFLTRRREGKSEGKEVRHTVVTEWSSCAQIPSICVGFWTFQRQQPWKLIKNSQFVDLVPSEKLKDGEFLQDSPLSFLKYQDIDGMTPLMAAVDKDHVQTAKLLLDEVSRAKKKVSIIRFSKRIWCKRAYPPYKAPSYDDYLKSIFRSVTYSVAIYRLTSDWSDVSQT